MANDPLTNCVSCGESAGFVDLPPGSKAARWEGSEDAPMTMCKACGAWYPQTSIDASVRDAGPPAPDDGDYHALFAQLRGLKLKGA